MKCKLSGGSFAASSAQFTVYDVSRKLTLQCPFPTKADIQARVCTGVVPEEGTRKEVARELNSDAVSFLVSS